ncbi:unnamed protein product [Oppiella nova]|uniref:Maltase n=1 Tax=Oppiella nova TaxID=334625 RepID=A0A7R9LXY1_9ACAR|nr:unnamed protein product [Oppiella nova]CAG2168009.1 unnamed protein product [Oppiella nova]
MDKKLSESQCLERGCIYDPVKDKPEIPYCYFNAAKLGYRIDSTKDTDFGLEATLKLKDSAKDTKLVTQLDALKTEVTYLTENILRVKIFDANNKRYEVPIQSNFPLLQQPLHKIDENLRKYKFNLNKTDFGFDIERKSTSTKILDTSIGGLVFSDQFIQIASYLPSNNVYGLGENTHPSLRHNLNYKTWPLFTKDNAPNSLEEKNNYGQHPFYTVLESNGNSHGILLLNSNAMEYTLMPAPAVSVKTIGGILDFFVFVGDNPEHTIGGILDFFVFVGDNPEHVIQLYTSLIGRTFMPSFWAFGFQISKYGYHNTNMVKAVVERQIKHEVPYLYTSLIGRTFMPSFWAFGFQISNSRYHNTSQVRACVERQIKHEVPYDVQYVDNDYQEVQSRDFTIDPVLYKDLPQLISDTQTKYNLHWTPIINPHIQGNEANYTIFSEGNDKNVFIKWPKSIPVQDRHNPDGVDTTHDNMYGRVWPPVVAFPDYFKNVTHNWWIDSLNHLHSIGWKFNSLWIDMNEPITFDSGEGYNIQCPHNQYDNIPIEIKAQWVHGSDRLSRSTLCMIGVQGESGQFKHYDVHSLYGLTMAMATQKSTYVSSGQYAGHWLGDNKATWLQMRESVIGILDQIFVAFLKIQHQNYAVVGHNWEPLHHSVETITIGEMILNRTRLLGLIGGTRRLQRRPNNHFI